MKVIYIAGKFRGDTYWQMVQNIRRAEEKALDLWQSGYAVICPHLNTRNFQGACPDEVWLEGSLEIMKRCDIVYFLSNWRTSYGAQEEHQLALRLNRKILYEEVSDIC